MKQTRPISVREYDQTEQQNDYHHDHIASHYNDRSTGRMSDCCVLL